MRIRASRLRSRRHGEPLERGAAVERPGTP